MTTFRIGLHAQTVGVQMPAKGTCFPDHPPADHTFTHEHCRIGEQYLGGADHPLNPRGDLSGLTREELDTGCLVYIPRGTGKRRESLCERAQGVISPGSRAGNGRFRRGPAR